MRVHWVMRRSRQVVKPVRRVRLVHIAAKDPVLDVRRVRPVRIKMRTAKNRVSCVMPACTLSLAPPHAVRASLEPLRLKQGVRRARRVPPRPNQINSLRCAIVNRILLRQRQI